MPTSREYAVVLTPEAQGGYSVVVPAFPGCTSQGKTREEALSMIREAIEVYIESLVAHGDPIPDRSRSSESPSWRNAGAPGRHATDGANPTLGQPPFPQQAGFSLRACPMAPTANVFESSA